MATPYPQPQASTGAAPAPSPTSQQEMDALRRTLGAAAGGSAPQTADEARLYLQAHGVNVDDPAVQSLLQKPTFWQQIAGFQGAALVSELATSFPEPRSSQGYYDALNQYGLGDAAQVLPGIPRPGQLPSAEAAGQQLVSAIPPKYRGGVYTDPKTGAAVFRNGVVVDPSGGVLFPPGKNVPGSLPWLRKIQREWNPQDFQQWRKTLVKFGYLPRAQAKSGRYDTALGAALVQYWQAYYVNHGTPVPADTTGASSGFQDLHQHADSIKEGVRQQYMSLFGVLPSDHELQSWTNFVIHTGNTMQHAKALTPTDAQSEAQSRFSNQLLDSPAGQYRQDQLDTSLENTTLRDSLVSASQALGGLG